MSIKEISPTYRIPELLRDLLLIDMLELSGSTLAAAQLLNLSQPTVSRRYRAVAEELGLIRSSSQEPGRRFGDSDCLRLLRKVANLHRWQSGVLRVGINHEKGPDLPVLHWIQWVELSSTPRNHWGTLFRHELLDAVAFADGEQIDDCLHAIKLNTCTTVIADFQLLYRRHPRIERLIQHHQRCQPIGSLL